MKTPAKNIEKFLSLTHYVTLVTLIGYCIIANQSCCKHWYIITKGLAIQKGSAHPFYLIYLSDACVHLYADALQ